MGEKRIFIDPASLDRSFLSLDTGEKGSFFILFSFSLFWRRGGEDILLLIASVCCALLYHENIPLLFRSRAQRRRRKRQTEPRTRRETTIVKEIFKSLSMASPLLSPCSSRSSTSFSSIVVVEGTDWLAVSDGSDWRRQQQEEEEEEEEEEKR